MMMGTLNYMAPEQVRGERTDHRADIFSFGVVLYEMISGRKAFQGDSFATTLYKILQDVPEPLNNIDPTLPHEVVRLVEKTLAKPKDERYQDLTDVTRDLALHPPAPGLSDSDTDGDPGADGFRSPSTRRAAVGSAAPSGGPARTPAQRPKSGPQTLDPSAPTISPTPRRRSLAGEPSDDHAIACGGSAAAPAAVVDRRDPDEPAVAATSRAAPPPVAAAPAPPPPAPSRAAGRAGSRTAAAARAAGSPASRAGRRR